MAEQLEQTTERRMRALCNKIAVAHDLDPAIQDELFGHMEDKLHAYLDGEETLTEDDAFILVEKHFGDPAVVKGLMGEVHAVRVHVSLARRFAALLTADLFCHVLAKGLMCGVALLLFRWEAENGSNETIGHLWGSTIVLSTFATTLLCGVILFLWQRNLGGGTSWFLRWSPLALTGLVTSLMLCACAVPFPVSGDLHALMLASGGRALTFAIIGVTWGAFLARVVLWLWWCDRPPRTAYALACAFGVFVLLHAMMALVPPVQLLLHTAQAEAAAARPFWVTLIHGVVGDAGRTWALRLEIPSLVRLQAGAFTTLFVAAFGVAGSAVYAVLRRLVPSLKNV